MRTAVVTDSNSGITQAEAKELGICVVPMPVLITETVGGKEVQRQFFEDLTLTQEEFYEKLKSDCKVSTSQPNPYDVGEMWNDVLKDYDELVYIPMSSGLSDTCKTLTHYAETEFPGRVYVVDNQRISTSQRQSVYDAIKLANEGKSAREISDWLTETKMISSIYIMVDTLEYLRKGGRLTPAAAAIGSLFKIKPVLQIQGEKLDQYKKVRKLNDAKAVMIDAMKKDFEGRFAKYVADGRMTLSVAHTQNYENAEIFAEQIKETFPGVEFTFINPLSLSVSCHIGPGSLAIISAIKA